MKIGIIGCGNMANAILSGLIENEFKVENIMISDHRLENLERIKSLNVNTSLNNKEVANFADYLILAVKPRFLKQVCEEIHLNLSNDQVVISIAAGYEIRKLQADLKFDKVVRVMPNTAALVSESMSAICLSEAISQAEANNVINIFKAIGQVELIDEELMPAVIAVSGSAPAYGYLMLEAMGDAACQLGMSREQAYKFAAQTLKGVGEMYLETETHPGKLKDSVCSAKGTTIEAVRVLETKGFRSAIIEAMITCGNKSQKM